MLAANSVESATAALMADAAQFRNDVATSALALVNAVQSSPTNSQTAASMVNPRSKVESALVADWNQMRQAFIRFEYAVLGAYQQEFTTLLADWSAYFWGPTPSLSPPDTGGGIPTHPRTGPIIGDPAISAIDNNRYNWLNKPGLVQFRVTTLDARRS
jgi:hypothetical protein